MYKSKLMATVIASVLGLASSGANAAAISSITLGDIDGDGAVSGFRFTTAFDTSFPNGVPGTFPSDLTFGGAGDDCGGGPGSCGDLVFGGAVGVDVFTSGFNFGGGGDFKPLITGNSTGDVTGGVLDLTTLDFAGLYNGTTYFMPPQDLGDVTGNPGDVDQPIFPADGAFTGGSTTGLDYYLDSWIDNGDGTYGFIMRWSSVIDQGSSFDGSIARWRLEGTMNTVPVPAAVWLFGSGLLGLVGVARRKKSS